MKTGILNFLKNLAQTKFFSTIATHKIIALITAAVVVLTATTVGAIVINTNKKPKKAEVSSTTTTEDTASEIIESQEPIVEEVVSQESSEVSSIQPVVSAAPVTSTVQPTPPTPVISGTDYKYNSNMDIDDNVFMDSLIYTGYNIEKHRADGLMWQYVLASQKRGKGWLSNIGYAGGSSGYETVNGKPDIATFEKKGLVCASYVTYVYFNYLPNVAGIDTSSLTRPVKSYSAHDWYIAAKDWIAKGYSKSVGFTASLTSSGFIKFSLDEDMPIGSIMVFRDARKNSDHGSHVAIYAGYKNGYHWVYHVGNENGPEFCAVERMHFGPDPQWPLMMITAPSNIRMSALVEIDSKDNTGAAVSGLTVSLYNTKTGKTTDLGSTDTNGYLSKENLSYGDYTLTFNIPEGYTTDSNTMQVKLITANNSCNKISITLNKIVPPVVEEPPVLEEPPEQSQPESQESSQKVSVQEESSEDNTSSNQS